VQSITTLRREKLVDNQVENKKDEHTEVSETLQKGKGKQVINETSTSADPGSRHHMYPEPHSQNGSRHLLTLENKERKYKQ
jgi:hypothetical protein